MRSVHEVGSMAAARKCTENGTGSPVLLHYMPPRYRSTVPRAPRMFLINTQVHPVTVGTQPCAQWEWTQFWSSSASHYVVNHSCSERPRNCTNLQRWPRRSAIYTCMIVPWPSPETLHDIVADVACSDLTSALRPCHTLCAARGHVPAGKL